MQTILTGIENAFPEAYKGIVSPIMMCYILMMVGLVGVAGTFAAKKKGFRKNH